jgi:hypothetical protein
MMMMTTTMMMMMNYLVAVLTPIGFAHARLAQPVLCPEALGPAL